MHRDEPPSLALVPYPRHRCFLLVREEGHELWRLERLVESDEPLRARIPPAPEPIQEQQWAR